MQVSRATASWSRVLPSATQTWSRNADAKRATVGCHGSPADLSEAHPSEFRDVLNDYSVIRDRGQCQGTSSKSGPSA